ncbi:tubulin-specific chaperone, putative [Plasmodium vinckei brucechwatti]|uniref:Tubulin-specific chaperone, putative n=1 Tax=Plasmodium vinckei brucechwatti TaxID=119398 RepID=A0A6V7S657_PLAVN|nr:tubulin-specific chaperone, putative [Plasmodium vinckei brucechwatti]
MRTKEIKNIEKEFKEFYINFIQIDSNTFCINVNANDDTKLEFININENNDNILTLVIKLHSNCFEVINKNLEEQTKFFESIEQIFNFFCPISFKKYITKNIESNSCFYFTNKMNDYIKVDLIHNLYKNKKWKEIKLNKFDTLNNIKKKIYGHTGTSADNMNLYAYDELNIENTQIFLNNDKLTLNDYGVKDNYIIYIHEINPTFHNDIIYNIDDEQNLEKLKHLKYQINDEDYDKRQDSFRKFIQKIKQNQKNTLLKNQEENIQNSNHNLYNQELYKIGSRCRIIIGDRRGTLKFVGHLKNNDIVYVGVDLDEPLGNSDGFYQKKKLFECKGDKYGYIGNINSVEVGDFPPFDIMDFDEF